MLRLRANWKISSFTQAYSYSRPRGGEGVKCSQFLGSALIKLLRSGGNDSFVTSEASGGDRIFYITTHIRNLVHVLITRNVNYSSKRFADKTM